MPLSMYPPTPSHLQSFFLPPPHSSPLSCARSLSALESHFRCRHNMLTTNRCAALRLPQVYRQAKLRCGGPDGQLGRWLHTFQGPKNVTSSLQICADAGEPNIARLPALQGAKIIYDISSESGKLTLTCSTWCLPACLPACTSCQTRPADPSFARC